MSGSYVVLARKWRPAQFADIVGQGHIVRTLSNAIRAKRIHQAYLFTGSRGIGKTSIARIFAKVIRCPNAREVGEGENKWLVSCDECASCREITGGSGTDVIEIDGASNNGVEAVREIRENAKYLPSIGERKIYIIDEVHMLTTAAFNALLKTLEEPPAHVIFVFATTEPHKIPATILSRCQRFDFRRVTVAQIQTRLTEVTGKEGVRADPGALALIARAAEGSMRDSLSLLDQVIAFSGNEITTQSVRDSVGLIEAQTLLGILRGVFARQPLDALKLVDQAYQQGHDLRVLTRSLIEFLHGAILVKAGATGSNTLEFSEEEWKELQEIAALRSLEEIELFFQVLHHGLEWIARSPQPKIVLDVLLVKCATAEELVVIGSGAQSTAMAAAIAAPQTAAPASPPAPAKPVAAAPAPVTPVTFAAPAPAAVNVATPAKTPTVPVTATAGTAAAATAAAGPKTWEGLIDHVRKTRPLLASILEHGNCTQLPGADQATLEICFNTGDSYFREQAQQRVYHEQIILLSREYFGIQVMLRIETRDGGESLAVKREREQNTRTQAAKDAVQTHPIIQEAKALFGGELGDIELGPDGGDS